MRKSTKARLAQYVQEACIMCDDVACLVTPVILDDHVIATESDSTLRLVHSMMAWVLAQDEIEDDCKAYAAHLKTMASYELVNRILGPIPAYM